MQTLESVRVHCFPSFLRRIAILMLATICAVFCSGCGSPKAALQVKVFSDAVTLTSSNASSAISLAQDLCHQRQVLTAASEFERSNNGETNFNLPIFTNLFTPDQIQINTEILTGLELYATSLSKLMGNPTLTNLDQETTALGVSLTNLNADVVKTKLLPSTSITPQEIAILTTSVNVVGNFLITLKEQKEAKAAIQQMSTKLPPICNMFEAELAFVGNEVQNSYDVIVNSRLKYLIDNRDGITPLEKRSEIDEFAKLKLDQAKAVIAFQSTKKGIQKIVVAHKALQAAFAKDTDGISAAVADLLAEGQRGASYYRSLNSTNK